MKSFTNNTNLNFYDTLMLDNNEIGESYSKLCYGFLYNYKGIYHQEFIIDQGIQISEQPVQSCFRLGRCTENKVSPIKITFCHKVGQIKIIENLSSLKGSVEDFSRVSVCIDRNEDERKVMKELVQRAKQSTDKNMLSVGHTIPISKK